MWWMQESTILYCQYSLRNDQRDAPWVLLIPFGPHNSCDFMCCRSQPDGFSTARLQRQRSQRAFSDTAFVGTSGMVATDGSWKSRHIYCLLHKYAVVCVWFLITCVYCKSVKVPKLRHCSRYLDGLSTCIYDLQWLWGIQNVVAFFGISETADMAQLERFLAALVGR